MGINSNSEHCNYNLFKLLYKVSIKRLFFNYRFSNDIFNDKYNKERI